MALTRVEISGVAIDEVQWSWPLYRGVYARVIELRLSLAKYAALKAAFARSKGIASLTITCSEASGSGAGARTETISGIRVIELVKNNDLTCTLKMADARLELMRFIAVANINTRWRNEILTDTACSDMAAALRKLCARCMDLFAPDGFTAAQGVKVPEDVFTAGGAKTRGLDHLLSAAGLDLTVNRKTALLSFVTREDIGSKPTKARHAWVRGKRPGWETDERNKYRLPRKLRYAYRRRHMKLVRLTHSGSTVTTDQLGIIAEPIYFDDGFIGTTKTGYLTGKELFAKYRVGIPYDDALIAKHIMSANFDGTPLERNGSAERDALLRILKRDWMRCFRLRHPGPVSPWGAFTELLVGIFAKDANGNVTDEVLAAGVRGNWTEFLNVVDGGGPNQIINQKIFTNHDDPPALPMTTMLPTMPFSGAWESEQDGVLRLHQQQLPDGNLAMPGLVQNPADLTIHSTTQIIHLPGGGITSRWLFELPTIDKAQLSLPDMYLLLIGTQRLPNDEQMFKVHELEGFPDGTVPFQEFEVSELAALYDFVDTDVRGRIDLQLHPPEADGQGRQLNEQATREDAEARAEAYRAEAGRAFDGEGEAAGLSGLDESIDGAIDEIDINMRGIVITSTIRCGNLAPDFARQERAKMRAQARNAKLAGKEKVAV